MTTHAILQDMSLCMECQGCRVACQMQNGLTPEQVYIKFRFHESGSFPKVKTEVSRFTCFHCEEAGCVKACPFGAVYKGATGLTHFDLSKCADCGRCGEFCPFDIPTFAEYRPFRCGGCEPLTENGKAPACVSTCMANALTYGPREEMLKKANQRVATLKKRWPNAQVYNPSGVKGTGLIWVLRDKPDVYSLPANPTVDPSLGWLKDMAQPGGGLALAGSALMAGLGFIISRRNLLKETNEGKEG